MKQRRDERGVALLTVLLLVAAMSVIAVAVLDDIRFAIRRTSNQRSLAQAQWYALGAESLAKARLSRVLARRSGVVTLDGGWSGAPLVFPIDHGELLVRLSDRGACFNLNSVVVGDPNEPISDATGIGQFADLLEAVGVGNADALRLSASLADWIDADNAASLYGAEDEAYQSRTPSYRTAGVILSEESELRAVQGFTPEIYARIRPFVCALPQTGPTRVNVNTLRPEEAPVLTAVYSGRLPVEAARRAIEARPEEGWSDEGAFLQEPALKAAVDAGGDVPLQQLAVASRYFALDSEVLFDKAELITSALLEAEPSGAVRTHARRWTPAE